MTAIPLGRPTGGRLPVPALDVDATEAVAVFQGMARRRRATMVWRRAFPGALEQAREARAFTRLLLADAPYVADAVQVVAEMAANALVHTRSGQPGGLYVLELRRWPGGASLALADQGGPSEPRLGGGEPAEHGYGLRTVQALASWWGWRGDQRGRTVTAIFMRSPASTSGSVST